MTVDEAIKHCEEVAKEQEELYGLCPGSESEYLNIIYCDGTKDCKVLTNGKDKGCLKCAKEHRQLAKWLRDYKRLLEQPSWIPVKTRPLTDEEKDVCGENWSFMYDCELPADEQEVLITTNTGSVEQVTFYKHSEYGCYFEYYEDEGDVVAWMPLPEPFKPQESEDKE